MLVTASGELEPVEREMAHRAFEFSDREVMEVMIPRPALESIEDSATVEDFLKMFSQVSHSRFPVYAGNLDNVVGFVWVKDVLRALANDPQARTRNIKSLTRNPLFVPSTKHIGDLFEEMQHQKVQLAIVLDEYGGTAGMVTIEELIEEIVGRVSDELTSGQPPFRTLDEKRTEADASLRVDEVNEQLGLGLPESDDYETLAGLVMTKLGRVPKEGEAMQIGNVKLMVSKMDGPRTVKIMIIKG